MGTRVLLSLILLGFGSAVSARQAIEQEFDFDIQQQAVHTALVEFAEQADLTLVFPDDVVRNKSANALIGKYTLQDGVEVLLAGTGLTPMFSDRVVLSITAEQQLTNKGNTVDKTKTAPLLKRLGTTIATVMIALSGTGTVAAQDGDDEPRNEIEEVIVTATYRDTRLMDTPISISAVTAEDIQVKGIEDIQTLYQSIPGLSYRTGTQTLNFLSVRGITPPADGGSAVGVYLDNIPMTDNNSGGKSQPLGAFVRHGTGRGVEGSPGHALWRKQHGRLDPLHHQQGEPECVRDVGGGRHGGDQRVG